MNLQRLSDGFGQVRHDEVVPEIGEPDVRLDHVHWTRREQLRTCTGNALLPSNSVLNEILSNINKRNTAEYGRCSLTLEWTFSVENAYSYTPVIRTRVHYREITIGTLALHLVQHEGTGWSKPHQGPSSL